MRASAATLLLIGALLLFSPSPATSETLDLDADDVPSDTDKAAPADFTIPVKINGEQVDCGFWKGQDPAEVAIEFGTLHNLDGKKIGRLKKALVAEAVNQGLMADPDAAQVQEAPSPPPPPEQGTVVVKSGMPIALAGLNERWANMQVATIKFAHSPFCQKFCTKENGGVLGLAVLIALINAAWAMMRYKGRKDKVKKKMEELEKLHEEQREQQKQLFENCVSASEAEALRGAFKNQIKNIQKKKAESEAEGGWRLPSFGQRKNIRD